MPRICLPLVSVLCAACGLGGDGGGWPLAPETGPTGVEVVDGDFSWSQLSPAEPDGGFFRIEHGADGSLWFIGRKAARWDGAEFLIWPLAAEGAPAEGFHFAETLAVLAADDVWACGTAIWHFDGTVWTEVTFLADAAVVPPTPVDSNRCEVATDGTATFVNLNHQLYEVVGDALVSRPPATDPFGAPVHSIAVIDGAVHGVTALDLDPTLWDRDGNTFYSVGADIFSGEGAFCMTEAVWPAAAACVTPNLAMAELPWIGGYLDANEADTVLRTGFAHGDTADGWIVAQGRLEPGEGDLEAPTEAVPLLPFGFLVRAADGEIHTLPDRFYNLETYRVAELGGELFVTTSGGAVHHGVAP